MGVKDLWQILDDKEIARKVPLSYLRGKRVAVDLSGWVVQSNQCPGLNLSRKPHLKNLFHRVSHLLTNGALPIFVIDGKPPDLKGNTIKKRLKHSQDDDCDNAGLVTRFKLDQVLSEIVDGCITQDSDAFPYGATTVFRDFTVSPPDPHMKVYNLNDIEKELGLNQDKFIALALLLGCDYAHGVQGIGKETALKLLKEMKSTSTLQRFREWKEMSQTELFPKFDAELDKESPSHCSRCGHPGRYTRHKQNGCSLCCSEITCYMMKNGETCPCDWHQNQLTKEEIKIELKVYRITKDMLEFPDEEVINEYLIVHDKMPDAELKWVLPDISSFKEKAFNWLGWTAEECSKKTLPLFTSWQIAQLHRRETNTADFLYDPVRINKKRKKWGTEYYEVYWNCKDGDNVEDGISLPKSTDDEGNCTLEDIASFSKAYPHVVAEFLNSIEKKKCTQKKSQKEKKGTSKKTKSVSKTSVDSASEHNSSRKVESIEIITLSPLPSTPTLQTSENVYCSENCISTPKTDAVLNAEVLLNFSMLESDDSFIDMPLTQRLQINSLHPHKKKKSTISILSTQKMLPLPASLQFSGIGNVESVKSASSSQDLGIFKPETEDIQFHTPNLSLEFIYSNASRSYAEENCTPLRKPIYSVRESCAKMNSEVNCSNLYTNTPHARDSCVNYLNMISSFERMKVSTPVSFKNEYDASEELFPSLALNTLANCDDSVICLN